MKQKTVGYAMLFGLMWFFTGNWMIALALTGVAWFIGDMN
jgi:hypothetical protein